MNIELEKLKNFKFVVLSYDGSDRLATIEERLSGIDYEIHYGINKDNINIDKLSQDGYTGFGDAKNFTQENFACTFGHIQIIEKYQNIENLVILEDDVYFKYENIQSFIDGFNELPNDWDIYYGGFVNLYNNLSPNYSPNLHKITMERIGGTNCYMYSKNFKDKYLNMQKTPNTMNPIADAAHWFLIHTGINAYASLSQMLPQINK